MKKTMLTYKTLDRFEREYKTEHYTPEQIETIEHAAYVANMNQCNNPEWTEADIFADFIRVLGVHKIETETAEADETETEPETAKQATPDGIAYEIRENSEYNSREVYFSGKPAAETREALKALKMRWHGKKSCWYGYATAEDIAAAIAGEIVSGAAKTAPKAAKPPKKNKFGVQVGDIFSASWGYDQTQTDFFQVVELVGELSVRVREVYPRMIEEDAVSPMSADRTYKITRDILPPAPHSVFIEDQERGDIKRLKSYDKDGKRPEFRLSSFAYAQLCESETKTTYESWYR